MLRLSHHWGQRSCWACEAAAQILKSSLLKLFYTMSSCWRQMRNDLLEIKIKTSMAPLLLYVVGNVDPAREVTAPPVLSPSNRHGQAVKGEPPFTCFPVWWSLLVFLKGFPTCFSFVKYFSLNDNLPFKQWYMTWFNVWFWIYKLMCLGILM